MSEISQYITMIGAAVAIVISVLNFFYTRKDTKKKMGIETDDSAVKNAKEIQEMYELAFEKFELRQSKILQEQERDCEQKINGLRESLEDEMREKIGEHLVLIEDLKTRNQDLKLQVVELGGVVQGVTGLKLHQWSSVPEKK